MELCGFKNIYLLMEIRERLNDAIFLVDDGAFLFST